MSKKTRPEGTLYAVRVGPHWATEDDPYCDRGAPFERWTGSHVKALSILYEWRRYAEEETTSDLKPSDIRLVAILPRSSRAEAIREARIEGMEWLRDAARQCGMHGLAVGLLTGLIEKARKATP